MTKEQALTAGGKGRTLARLYQAGYRVPDGFILLPGAFVDDDLKEEAWFQAQAQLTRLRLKDRGKTFFAVRSSAIGEDSAQASFAGEFETVLDVCTDEDIRAAILAVRRSWHAARVQAYHRAQKLEQAKREIAVVVQCLIRADYAGVLFTADPITGDLMRMTGNFVAGLGEKLVSGQANAQTFTFDRPNGAYHGPTVLQRVARELYGSACRLEKELGGPQDIEWAVASGQLYLLQARAITTLNGYKPETCEWNDSLRGNFLWTGANTGEAIPHVLTPFSASVQKSAGYRGVTFADGSTWGLSDYPFTGIIGGRAYINLSLQLSVFRPFFGGTQKALRQITSIWGDIPSGIDIPLIPISTWYWWTSVLPRLLVYALKLAIPKKEIIQFVAESPQWCATMVQRVKQINDPAELKTLFISEIVPHSRHGFFLALAGGNAVNFALRLEDELRKLVGADDANALLSNLSGPSGALESLGPVVGLAKVAGGELSRAAYLEAYGHRGENEIEYAWPRPLEDPAWLDRQLAEFVRTPVNVEAMLTRQRAAFTAAWQRYCKRYPWKVKSMQRRLEGVAQAARQREAVRSEAIRCALPFRAYALRAGELMGIGDDVFFLTGREVLDLLDGDNSACRLIPLRKETYERYRTLPTYPAIIIGRFDPFQWAADPNRRNDLFYANIPMTAQAKASSNMLRGFAGALGVVEGAVRRLERLEESDQLQPGEILVAKLTNIGWTPIFPRVAAIVTDLGAPLSHAAIVARELGIPAVVGCGDATTRLKTGDFVRVDGGQGLIEILKSA